MTTIIVILVILLYIIPFYLYQSGENNFKRGIALSLYMASFILFTFLYAAEVQKPYTNQTTIEKITEDIPKADLETVLKYVEDPTDALFILYPDETDENIDIMIRYYNYMEQKAALLDQ